MKVATWNVNGIRAREAQFVEWARRDRPDIICLQEIKATQEQLGEALTMLPEYTSYWHGGAKGYSGVSLHFRKETYAARPTFSHPSFDFENRVVEGRVDGGPTVLSVYVPNGGKDFGAKLEFLKGLRDHVATLAAQGSLVVCGDLNVARTEMDVYPKDRNPTVIGQRPDERALLEEILAHGMVDVGRALHPDKEGMFTWWAPWRNMRQKNQGWRIDFVLASQSLAAKATDCSVLAEVGTSDHAPVLATFDY